MIPAVNVVSCALATARVVDAPRVVLAVELVSAALLAPYWKYAVPASPRVFTYEFSVALLVPMAVAGAANTEGEPMMVYAADTSTLAAFRLDTAITLNCFDVSITIGPLY